MWKLTVSENPEILKCIKDIETRSLADGGFSEQTDGPWRPDSTAWAVLALESAGINTSIVASGKARLAAGRFSLPGAPDVLWTVPLAILAWREDPQYGEAQNRAVDLLLKTRGNHWNRNPNDPAEHDTSIHGWPWVAGMHSFAEPTAMALLALETTRHENHPRFLEGVRMLMNRRLSRGGWNFGNTRVYGSELFPFVDTTGVVLTALAGHTPKENVEKSLNYLEAEAQTCRTPLSLGWALFGLGAWGIFPGESKAWIEQTLARQEKFGPYGTSLLSLLALTFFRGSDFRNNPART